MILKNGEKVNIYVSTGNGKTGIDSFNTLAGGSEHAYTGYKNAEAWEAIRAKYGDVCGTCGGDCPGCYAKKMTRFPAVLDYTAGNTVAVTENPAEAIAELERAIYGSGSAPAYFRWHDSGEFFSFEYFAEACELMKRHPETRFGAYTKAAEVVNRYGIENLPENFSLQCSPWEGYCEPIGDLPQFIYDDGSDPAISALPHCPAVDKNGKRTGVKCIDCLYCYHAKRGGKRAVYAH